jgi:hypothetical protein
MTAPISSNDTAKTSCRTNASRSAGLSVSSTTIRATPTESAGSASSSGPVRLVGRRPACGAAGSGGSVPADSSGRVPDGYLWKVTTYAS